MAPVLFIPAVMAAEQVGAGREELEGTRYGSAYSPKTPQVQPLSAVGLGAHLLGPGQHLALLSILVTTKSMSIV
jgi:hypothetical protein